MWAAATAPDLRMPRLTPSEHREGMTTTPPLTPCRSCGHLGDHDCPADGVWTGRGLIGGYLDTREGTIRHWAYRLDCATQGCEPPHSDGDRIRALDLEDFEYLYGIARSHRIGPAAYQHAVQILTRVVHLPQWEVQA